MDFINVPISILFPYFANTRLPFTEPEFYVWGFCAGFNIAMIFAFVLKGVESRFVNMLFDKKAFGKDSAITIAQAGVKNSALLRFILKNKSTLRKIILLADDNNGTATDLQNGEDANGEKSENRKETVSEVTLDFNVARFYISEEKFDRAESLKKGTIKWYLLPIFCVVSIGLAMGVCYLLPIFLNW